MTENHGVPGSNPASATSNLPAKSRKKRSLDSDAKNSPRVPKVASSYQAVDAPQMARIILKSEYPSIF
jgi:hypothetical protein